MALLNQDVSLCSTPNTQSIALYFGEAQYFSISAMVCFCFCRAYYLSKLLSKLPTVWWIICLLNCFSFVGCLKNPPQLIWRHDLKQVPAKTFFTFGRRWKYEAVLNYWWLLGISGTWRLHSQVKNHRYKINSTKILQIISAQAQNFSTSPCVCFIGMYRCVSFKAFDFQ